MHPVESSFRSEMQRKLRLQPPLSLVQSLTGPNESRRTSNDSKDELIISSSLLRWKGVGKRKTCLVVGTFVLCVNNTEDWFEFSEYSATFIEARWVDERRWKDCRCTSNNNVMAHWHRAAPRDITAAKWAVQPLQLSLFLTISGADFKKHQTFGGLIGRWRAVLESANLWGPYLHLKVRTQGYFTLYRLDPGSSGFTLHDASALKTFRWHNYILLSSPTWGDWLLCRWAIMLRHFSLSYPIRTCVTWGSSWTGSDDHIYITWGSSWTRSDEDIYITWGSSWTRLDDDIYITWGSSWTRSDEDMYITWGSSWTRSDNDIYITWGSSWTWSDDDIYITRGSSWTLSDDDIYITRGSSWTRSEEDIYNTWKYSSEMVSVTLYINFKQANESKALLMNYWVWVSNMLSFDLIQISHFFRSCFMWQKDVVPQCSTLKDMLWHYALTFHRMTTYLFSWITNTCMFNSFCTVIMKRATTFHSTTAMQGSRLARWNVPDESCREPIQL